MCVKGFFDNRLLNQSFFARRLTCDFFFTLCLTFRRLFWYQKNRISLKDIFYLSPILFLSLFSWTFFINSLVVHWRESFMYWDRIYETAEFFSPLLWSASFKKFSLFISSCLCCFSKRWSFWKKCFWHSLKTKAKRGEKERKKLLCYFSWINCLYHFFVLNESCLGDASDKKLS